MASQTGRFRSFLDGLVEPQPADESFRTRLSRVPAAPEAAPAVLSPPAAKIPLRRQIDNYVALTKPGILTLLLATELSAMLVAAEGLPSFRIVVAAMLGGLFSAAGANALNCYIDRDIDKKMSRTQHRATASGEISPRNALIYGLTRALFNPANRDALAASHPSAHEIGLSVASTNPPAPLHPGAARFYRELEKLDAAD